MAKRPGAAVLIGEMAMRLSRFLSTLVSFPSATLASLCCLLPLAVVLLGLGSGAFMMATMKYSTIFVPLGVLGVGLGYFFYFQEKRRCRTLACPMKRGTFHLIILIISTLMVSAAVLLNLFPETSALILTGTP
ncbi:MAG: hypothetical protein JRG73_20005 [Deltaproteobacteria bacterium]|nr:hypothetical protein [Deltaproteobacteria bacterium]MBW2309212.1 hypothetical protein [Deltaproteobacteria bacterium]